jgi:hypothetical protein
VSLRAVALGAPLVLFAVLIGGGWIPPSSSSPGTPDVSPDAVAAATGRWLAACANAAVAQPEHCPQAALDVEPGHPGGFAWGPDRPLATVNGVSWSATEALFWVHGWFAMRLRHERLTPDGARQTYVARVDRPYMVAVRRAGQRTDFGAYAAAHALTFGDFVVFGGRSDGWSWQCCPRSDLVVRSR